jgi:hypothetical protein
MYVCVESLSHPAERHCLKAVFRAEYMDVRERKRRMGQFIVKIIPLLNYAQYYKIWKLDVQLHAFLTPALGECYVASIIPLLLYYQFIML